MQNVIVMTLWGGIWHFVYRNKRAYMPRRQHDSHTETESISQSGPGGHFIHKLLTADWGLIKFKLNGC